MGARMQVEGVFCNGEEAAEGILELDFDMKIRGTPQTFSSVQGWKSCSNTNSWSVMDR